jgi:hypothetical protein
MEAFFKHPRIGERKALQTASAQSADGHGRSSRTSLLLKNQLALAEVRIRTAIWSIVCATGVSAGDAGDLRHRLRNDDAPSPGSAEEQRNTNIRLKNGFRNETHFDTR